MPLSFRDRRKIGGLPTLSYAVKARKVYVLSGARVPLPDPNNVSGVAADRGIHENTPFGFATIEVEVDFRN